MEYAPDTQLFVRLISGTILGLTVGKLLSGSAKFVQHPHDYRINVLHVLWIMFIFGSVAVFWWTEALTFNSVEWTFPLYMFQIAYCASYLFMVAVLLPDELVAAEGHATHYDYFIARRRWFFGVLILSYLLGIGNALVKEGWDEIMLDPTFIALNVVVVSLLAWGMVSARRWVQVTIALIFVLLTVSSMFIE